jgi:hypothetical protein
VEEGRHTDTMKGSASAGWLAHLRAGLRSRAYYRVLRQLHARLRPETYLEIGIRKGDSLALATSSAVALGVDPMPMLSRPPAPNARVFAMTSDEFFAAHDVRELLGDRDLDLAFIDGMHLFEYVIRDFANVEQSSTPKTRVVLHDCLPIDAVTAARERTTSLWTGDVWKAALVLRRYRPDLRLTVIDVGPSGLVFVEGLDPSSSVLRDNADGIFAEYAGLDFRHWIAHRGEVLELVEDVDAALAKIGEARAT